ncbi:AAA family ATPase [Escherichia coli]|nr:AAA family ATPase [Escherichia coli]
MGKLTLVEQALRLHKEYYGEDNFGTVVKDCDYYPKVAEIFINRKNRKIYSNLDIEPVASTVIHTGSSPVMAKAGRIKKLMFKDGSGAYRIHLGQNEVVHIIRFILNSKVRMEYAVGTTKSMSMLHNLCEAGRAKLNRSLPRKGIWKLGYYDGVYYHGKARKEDYADDYFKDVCYAAAQKKIPVIIIAEEVDELYRADAGTLSFLDGADTPRNVAGTYVIFSTNYPKRIDPRIRKRPGRIDRIISVGAFRTKAAAACAKMYLPEDVEIDLKELGAVLDRTTPAEIKEIINIAIGMIRGTKNELSVDVIKNARAFLKGTLDLSVQEADEDIEEREELYKKNGAQPDYLSYLED